MLPFHILMVLTISDACLVNHHHYNCNFEDVEKSPFTRYICERQEEFELTGFECIYVSVFLVSVLSYMLASRCIVKQHVYVSFGSVSK